MELSPSYTDFAQEGNSLLNSIKKKVQRGTNLHEHILKNRLENLQVQLQQTKQTIVRNVIQSRALEQSKENLSIVQRALHQHIIDKNDPQLLRNIQMRKSAMQHNFSLEFDTEILLKISNCVNLPYPGIIKELLRILSEFSDELLVSTLTAHRVDTLKIVDESLFSTIVKLVSHNRISEVEISSMYQKSLQRLQRYETTLPNKKHWDVLKYILCRRLLTLHITENAFKFIQRQEKSSSQGQTNFKYSDTTSSTTTASTTNNTHHKNVVTLPLTASIALSRSVNAIPTTNYSLSNNHPQSSSSSTMKKSKSNKRHVITAAKQLEQELYQSLQRKESLKNQITTNLYDFCKTTKPSELFVTKPTHSSSSNALSNTADNSGNGLLQPTHIVKHYFHQIAVQKFSHLLYQIAMKICYHAIHHWKDILQQQHTEQSCIQFSQLVGTYRLIRYSHYLSLQHISIAYTHWLTFVKDCQIHEQLSSTITIQRYYRGYIARQYQKHLHTERAVSIVQQVVRIFLAKRIMLKLVNKRIRKKAVFTIEMFYKHNKLRFLMKKVLKQQLQMKSVLKIQHGYRHYQFMKRILMLKKCYYYNKGAKKMQCLFRRYQAILLYEQKKLHSQQNLAVINIQKIIRGKLSRKRYYYLLYQHHKVLQIQYAWWICKAKRRRHRLLVIRSIIRIQCAWRRKLAYPKYQKRYNTYQAYLLRRKQAIMYLIPYFLGYFVRRKGVPLLRKYKKYRNMRATQLQQYFQAIYLGYRARQYVKSKKDQLKKERMQFLAARTIQKYIRSKLLIRPILRQVKKNKIQQEKAIFLEERNKVPYYYRLKFKYQQDQYLYHKRSILILQCFFRRKLAEKKIQQIKITRQIAKEEEIKNIEMAKFQAEEEARQLESIKLQKKEQSKRDMQQKFNACIKIQSLVRAFVVNRNYLRNKYIPYLLWILRETAVRNKLEVAKRNHRIMKVEKLRRNKAANKIQAIIRGKLQRKKYKKSYRSLVKQREIRIRTKRLKSVIIIQCAYRMYRAKKRVSKQRAIVMEKRQELAELDELEKNLQGYHQSWMDELLTIRAQTGIRGMLARKNFSKKLEAYKQEQEIIKRQIRNKASTVIQAMVRGKLCRQLFKKNLPQLKKARKQRCFCTQCDIQIATKRCRQCRDKFCDSCYDFIHQKGNRKKHTFDIIRIDAKIMAIAFDQPSNASTSTNKNPGGDAAVGTKKRAINPKEWEEFYDESARAKYWFNKVTGEASWINPLIQH